MGTRPQESANVLADSCDMARLDAVARLDARANRNQAICWPVGQPVAGGVVDT
jgi:hypothetical protein